jgi:amino acid adenylation domain-containing protein
MSWQPTYAELDAVSNGLANAITERDGGQAGRVALLLRHDAPLVAALLAVLKAGATAVVLDPRWPPERLRRIREEVGARIVVADSAHRDLAGAAGCPPAGLIEVGERPEPDGGPPAVRTAPDDLAFLIQTSGSTGRPKGVMQTHRNVIHNAVVRLAGGLGLRPDDRIALLASPSGGQGVSTVWTALLTGATLCPFPVMDRGVTGLPDWLEEQGVTVLVSSASLFRHFARTLNGRRLPGIRLVRLGSEQVFASDFEAWRAHFADDARFVNSFSSSETGNVTQHILHAGDRVSAGSIPAGRPAAGIEVLLLEDGEIVVRSDYVSPGYWKDGELTGQRFGERIFRTGDMGRLSEDGVLTVLGRKDSQVKVRGSRVDLTEVESVLAARPLVAAAAVTTHPTSQGEAGLTAFVAVQPGAAEDAAAIREGIAETLPPHAVPTAFTFMDALPLNAHGKVDREALSRMEPEPASSSNGASPVSETEELLAVIWAEALERESVTPNEDFFTLRGDSLIAAEIAAAVQGRFGVEIELDAFADNPTVSAMAELIDRRRIGEDGAGPVTLARVSRDAPIPCSPIQNRTWRQSQTEEGSRAHNMASGVRIRGALDVEVLRRCINALVARHEALRTNFAERDGEPVQIVNPPGRVEVPLVQVTRPEEADELAREEASKRFDLERGPLVRFLLARLGEGEHRLLRLYHHINADGHSWQVFYRELAMLYEAELRGDSPPFSGPAPNQYADFAAWEHRTLRPGTSRWSDDVEWWRNYFEGVPVRTELPFARRERDEHAGVSEAVREVTLPASLTGRLDSLQRTDGATHFMVRLAAFAALLAVMSQQPDVVIGTYGTTRRLVETRDTFGFFANPLALRLQLAGRPSFRDWLADVRAAVIGVSAHAQTPYDALCEELRESGTIPPEFQAIFSVANDILPISFAGLEMSHLGRVFGAMPWGFTLQFRRGGENESFTATFDARVHEPRAVGIFLKRYQRLLGRVCDEPDRPLAELIPRRWRSYGPLLRRRVIDRG